MTSTTSSKTTTSIVPEEETSWALTKMFYFWASKQFTIGAERNAKGQTLEMDDLLHLPSDEHADTVYAAFKQNWADGKNGTLTSVLRKTFGLQLVIGGFFALFSQGCQIAAPFILLEFIKYLARYVFEPNTNLWEGYVWAVVLSFLGILGSYTNQINLHLTLKACQNMRAALTMAIYEKTLKLDGGTPHSGIIQQMHTTDVAKFFETGVFIHSIWTAPLIVIAALIGLYYFIGWAGVLSIGIIIFLMPFQGGASKTMMAARGACSERADKRIGAVNEFIQGIRVVKFMCWEEEVERKIAELRGPELGLFKRLMIVRSIFMLLITSTPQLITYGVFVIAYFWGTEITPKSVFPTMAMLNVLRLPLTFLPLSVARVLDMLNALRRIQAFLVSPEHITYLERKNNPESPHAIELENLTIQFPQPESKVEIEKAVAALKGGGPPQEIDYVKLFASRPLQDFMKDVKLNIPARKLTLIVGPTGSGKSSLVNVMTGEGWVKEGGRVTINHGGVALVTQEAWIMNATMRDNILMGAPFNEEKYLDVVTACQLMADLHQLSGSDMTEIGERGINLSGGQKQRVSFARAVYSERPIVLMDDPLSAVDAHVCVALFEQCILGAMKDRTRVLVTHQVQFLDRADFIIVVNNGAVEFQGTYEELKNSSINLDALIPNAAKEKEEEAKKKEAQELDLEKASPAEAPTVSPTSSPNKGTLKATSYKREIPAPRKEDSSTKLMSSETQAQGGIKKEIVMWFYESQGWWNVVWTAILFVVWRLVLCVSDLILSWWSSRTKILGFNLTQIEYIYYFAIFIGGSLIAIIFRQIPFIIGILHSARTIHERIITRLLHSPMSFFDTTPVGRILNRLSKDVEMNDLTIPETMNFFYQMTFVVLGAFGIMCYSAPYLSIIVVIVIFVYSYFLSYYTQTNRAVKRLDNIGRSPVVAVMNETLGGLSSIRSYSMDTYFSEKHFERFMTSMRPTYVGRIAQRWMGIRVDFFSTLVTLGTTFIGNALITYTYGKADQIDQLPVILLAITYAITVTSAIGFLSLQAAEFESMFSSVERLNEYTVLEQERDVTYSNAPDGQQAPPKNWPSQGEIVFTNVSMRYREGLPLVLQNISVNIQPRHKVGLVGRTGSGKSSILLGLFRMVELASGTITFDGIDISKLKMKDVRSAITIIPQDPLLFQGTIRSNLDPFFKHPPATVWKVLVQTGMAERVFKDVQEDITSTTPTEKWLQASIAERGSNYSVGQRQLLCLARALLKKTRILMLDEATASVDTEADDLIQRTIRSEFNDCTVLTIAHRLQTIVDADKVLVLDHGSVREYGTPRELLDNPSSEFHAMVSQLGEAKFAQLKAMVK